MTDESYPIIPDDGINITPQEMITDDNSVGIVEAEPGGETVTFQEARQSFALVRETNGHYDVGDADSSLFISCDGGELSVSYSPEFAPIETSIKVHQYETAINQFDSYHPQFSLMFDDAGLCIFSNDELSVAVAPTQYPWDKNSPATHPQQPDRPSL